MGRQIFRLPDIGEGVAEAEIVAWYVKVGDRIVEDQSLVDVMTDKATVDITSPFSGTVLAMHGEIGQLAAVGAALAEFEVEGLEDAPPTKAAPAEARSASNAAGPPGEAPLASPYVRNRAHELGIALQHVPGTGPDGRITAADLDRHIAGDASSRASGPGPRTAVEAVKIVGLRRKIAEKMQESKRRIPHFGYVEEFDLTELEKLRLHLNATKSANHPKLTLLPFFMVALTRVLPDYPNINARYDDEAGVLHRHSGIHIGIATQTPGGLTVAVVSHAEARDLWDCAAELGRVTQAARDGSAKREELTGSTITISSLGPMGGIAATPVINHPEVAIIGPNKLQDRAVVLDGQVVVRKMMNVSSSFDHRIVDGYEAAEFIQRIKTLIENPATLFMDQEWRS